MLHMVQELAPPRVLLTQGDPNGIGPEVVLKAASEPRRLRQMRLIAVGNPDIFKAHLATLHTDPVRWNVIRDIEEAVTGKLNLICPPACMGGPDVPSFGAIDPKAGAQSMHAVTWATEACLQGHADLVVTAPISKEAISKAGYDVPGHTEYIAAMAGGEPLMIMTAGRFRVALATTHIPISAVADALSPEHLARILRQVQSCLRDDFGRNDPTIAVLGLNPHAGDGGVIGTEEVDWLLPMCDEFRANGWRISGPHPPDGFFGVGKHTEPDVILAMYHDQGLVPFKLLAFDKGVNVTAGLSVVRTSPDHGTAFSIAGKDQASAVSMGAAIDQGVTIWTNRVVKGNPTSAAR